MSNDIKTECPFSDTLTVRKWTLVLFSVPIYYITPPTSAETYCDCGNFSHPMNSVSKASVPSYFFAQTYTICGLKKLKTLNLQVFITLQNLRNHFSTISAKINWHTTSCKYYRYKAMLMELSLFDISLSAKRRVFSSSSENCDGLPFTTLPLSLCASHERDFLK